jgi:hypothetical protein
LSTVIDSLVVELGLDPRKFTEGQREALAAFKKTQEGAEEFGKDIDAQGLKFTEIFGAIKKGLLGAAGAIGGYEGLAIINHLNSMDAATGRWAKTIGTNVENLSTWQGMIRQVGGSAEEATATMSALQDQINNVRMGSGMFDNQFGFLLNKIGGAQDKNADQIMRELQAYFANQIASGQMTPADAATQLRWVPGMNQNMINVMLSNLQKLEAAAKAAGTATKESAAEAIAYQESLNQLSISAEGLERVLVVKLTPSLVQFLDRTKQIIQELSRGIFISPDSWLGKLLGRTPAPAAAPSSGEGASFNDRFGAAGGGAPAGGTTRGDRNNNPGNIKFGPFAQAHGATGQDERGFAIFPTPSLGGAAQVALVTGTSYSGLTLDQFAARYAEGSQAWEGTVGGALGIRGGDIVNNQDPRLIDAIRRAEGTSQGARGAAAARGGGSTSTSTSTSEVNINNMHINAPNATDADGIAREIGPAMKRSAITSPANSGLA